MTYGAECWAVRKKDENRTLRMLRWLRGKTRKDHVRNQIIQEDAKVCQMSTFLRQKRLNWYGHIRREEDNLGVVHNCQHVCISTESTRREGGSEASVLFLKC